VPLEQPVRLVLVPGELEGVGELGLVLTRLQAGADATDPVAQEDGAERQAERRDPADQTDGPDRARVRSSAGLSRALITAHCRPNRTMSACSADGSSALADGNGKLIDVAERNHGGCGWRGGKPAPFGI
jgi:hypothetical protein